MMKTEQIRVAQINGGVFGSTGKIMLSIARLAEENGFDTFCAAPITKPNRKKSPNEPYYKIGNYYSRLIAVFFDRFFDNRVAAVGATKKLVSKLKEFAPDILHLHNIHGGYINLKILFKYIKEYNIKVVWTLHDCWAFTGHCPHFIMYNCEKWKTGCYKCPRYRDYPKHVFDNSTKMYRIKKELFTGIQNMTIVTPSAWLGQLVKQSFLKDYCVKVINNGIDLNVFKPIESSFKERYNIPKEKFILLGVAFGWGYRKGLDVFINLSKRLSDQYQIVLVGTDDDIDKQLPKNIISIHRTQNQKELAEIYTAADLFINPTREENFPTVNIESLACGTPVLTFKTGGSPEIIDETCGSSVTYDDENALEKEIIRIHDEKPYLRDACVLRATSFDMNCRFRDYIALYKHIQTGRC